ncbi:MAG: PA0069 family radical SAM protein [Phycisphaerales bacterium]
MSGTEREHADALPAGKVRGRGAGLNPGNRFEAVRLHVLGDYLDEVAAERPDGTQVLTRLYDDRSRAALNKVVDSPDIGFEWTVNPYRGCEHGCIYCYARPFHEYLGFSSGLDFETRIVVKRSAPARLRAALARPSWRGTPIVMSGVTDPYQPVEAKLRVTRGCLEVMAECRQPVAIITKSRLVLRDLDLLTALAKEKAASVALSITTLDHDLAAKMEPRASSPRARLEAVERLAAAGGPVRVMVAPIVPGLTDHEIPQILKAAAEAGADGAGYVLLRLPHQVKALFLEWLGQHFPDRASHVESQLRGARGGQLYDPRYFARQRGEGARADQIRQAFDVFRARFGLDRPVAGLSGASFRPPAAGSGEQFRLF